MSIFAPEDNGMVWSDGIQRSLCGKIAIGPEIFIPLPSLHPAARWRLSSTLTHQLCHLIFAYACAGIDMICTKSRTEQVNMGIDKTRQDGFPPQIEHLSKTPSHASYLVIR